MHDFHQSLAVLVRLLLDGLHHCLDAILRDDLVEGLLHPGGKSLVDMEACLLHVVYDLDERHQHGVEALLLLVRPEQDPPGMD